MTKIKTSNTTVGRPGFKVTSASGFTGSLVNRTKASKAGVRRMIARDPASGFSALLGTAKDILGFTDNPDVPNVTSKPSPRVLTDARANRAATAKGTERVVKRNVNRAIKRLK